MVTAKKYVVKKHFERVPKISDFEIVEYELPTTNHGDILVKTEFVSVDPYQKGYNSVYPVPFDQFGYNVGTILESKNADFPLGARVISHKGWCTHYVANPNAPISTPSERIYLLPDLKGLPISLGVGAIGMPGVTAYFGFLEICNPKPGETVVVTGAAGAVGSIVGQIAKIKGCRVIGFAGSDDKVEWLEKELGFDKAINYKTAEIETALKEAAPKGVDCFFDNVGGEISSTIIRQMNTFGRVSICGCISLFSKELRNLSKICIFDLPPVVISNQLKIEGFVVWKWTDRWSEALIMLTEWIHSGQMKAPEHVTEGFHKIIDAFVGMLAGENSGKAVVKI